MSPDPSSLAAATRAASFGDGINAGLGSGPAELKAAAVKEPPPAPRTLSPESTGPLAADQHGARFLAPATFLNDAASGVGPGGVDRFVVGAMARGQDGSVNGLQSTVVFPDRSTPRDTNHVSTWFEPSTDQWAANLSNESVWSNVPGAEGGYAAPEPDAAGGSGASDVMAGGLGKERLGPQSVKEAIKSYQQAENFSVGLSLAASLTQSTTSSLKRLSQGQ